MFLSGAQTKAPGSHHRAEHVRSGGVQAAGQRWTSDRGRLHSAGQGQPRGPAGYVSSIQNPRPYGQSSFVACSHVRLDTFSSFQLI